MGNFGFWRFLEHKLIWISTQADKLNTLIKTANVPDVEPIWAQLFARALEGKDVKELLTNVGSGGGAAAGGEAAAEKEEEKEEGASFPPK